MPIKSKWLNNCVIFRQSKVEKSEDRNRKKKPVLTKYVQMQLNCNLLIDHKLKWMKWFLFATDRSLEA